MSNTQSIHAEIKEAKSRLRSAKIMQSKAAQKYLKKMITLEEHLALVDELTTKEAQAESDLTRALGKLYE